MNEESAHRKYSLFSILLAVVLTAQCIGLMRAQGALEGAFARHDLTLSWGARLALARWLPLALLAAPLLIVVKDVVLRTARTRMTVDAVALTTFILVSTVVLWSLYAPLLTVLEASG